MVSIGNVVFIFRAFGAGGLRVTNPGGPATQTLVLIINTKLRLLLC